MGTPARPCCPSLPTSDAPSPPAAVLASALLLTPSLHLSSTPPPFLPLSSFPPDIMLEEYLDGPEVDVDLVLSGGEPVYGAGEARTLLSVGPPACLPACLPACPPGLAHWLPARVCPLAACPPARLGTPAASGHTGASTRAPACAMRTPQ